MLCRYQYNSRAQFAKRRETHKIWKCFSRSAVRFYPVSSHDRPDSDFRNGGGFLAPNRTIISQCVRPVLRGLHDVISVFKVYLLAYWS